MNSAIEGNPVFKNLRYFIRCCMPETQEVIKFDDMGICHSC